MKRKLLKRLSVRVARMLLVTLLLTMTAQTAWADSWTNAGGTGGSGTNDAPYYVNMPSKGTATTIGSAKTLNVPDGITSFKVYDNNGKDNNYSDNYTGYLVITAPTGSVLLLSGSIVTETNYDKLTVFDNGTASDPKLLDGVSGTMNDININSSGNVMTILFTSDGSTNGEGLNLTVTVISTTDLRAATISGISNYYLWNNGSAVNIDYTVKDVIKNELQKGTHYTAKFIKDGNEVNSVTDLGEYTLEITGIGSYSGTKTASFKVYKMLSNGSGTKADPYLISNTDDWTSFTYEGNADTYWASGVYVKMTADIGTTENPVTTMVGNQNNRFKGTFDGGGHTLVIQYGTADARKGDMFVAPFSYPENATIKNFHVAGYIYASATCIAGIASQMSGNSKILNCRCSVIFDSTTSGVSGIVNVYNGYGLPSGDVVIANCIFDGEFRYNNSTENGGWYGFGDNYISNFRISNCLFAPASMNIAKTTYTTTICNSSSSASCTIDNCYYTESLNVVQGNDASGMSAAELAAVLGPMWEVRDNKALPIYNTNHLSGATLTGLEPIYRHTGSEIALASLGYALTDMEGNALTLNTDYSVSLTCNGSAVSKVETAGDYVITFTGMGYYSGTKDATFKVMAYPAGLSIDYELTDADDGYFFVNAPVGSTANVDLTGVTDGFTFKVYDDGGKNGNYTCGVTETVVMTAPTDYVLQVIGTSKGELNDQLAIYDGNATSNPALYDHKGPDNIGTVISTGQSMTIYYKTNNNFRNEGLDLTVRLVNKNTPHDITINNPLTGGQVSSTPAATVNTEVTLTAEPANEYLLEGVTVTGSYNNGIDVDRGRWYDNNTATFRMPGTAVTVIPTFTNKKSAADGLYINMPTSGTVNATIPASVTSFKLYDDGGESGRYSEVCNGDLVLTAPTGYKFKLSGSIRTYYGQDDTNNFVYLTVYDGTETTDNTLINDKRSDVSDVELTLDPLYSTSNTMRVRFCNNTYSYSTTTSGLNLTVELINTNASYNVTLNNTEEHGVISSDKAASKVADIVTLTATTDDGYIVDNISVTDGNSQPVTVEGGKWYSYYTENKATFIMPNSEATVTSTFTNAKTAEDGLYINMEKSQPIIVAIPAGIQSFKVYDNGGADGDYPSDCRSTLVLTAPEGYQLKLTGTFTTDNIKRDHLTVYDGTDEVDEKALLLETSSTSSSEPYDIGTLSSTGRSMRLYFWTNSDDYRASGLDLKVEVVSSDEKHQIALTNTTEGSVTADMTEATIDQTVSLTLVPTNETYLPNGLNIACSDPVKLEWGGSFSNTATITMPYADVNVTPSFTNTWTADGGLFAIIPRDGNASVTIPAGVQSFKIYEHGGPTGDYDFHVEGTLTLTAPTGYKHQLTGTMTTEHSDLLWLRDVNANTYLLDMFSSTTDGEPRDIGTLTSSGETISLTFRSDWGEQYSGLDLTSTLVPISYNITYNGVEGATFETANPTTYTIEDAITLNNPTKDGYTFAGWYDNSEFTGSAVTTIASGSMGDKEFYAQWKKLMTNSDITISIPSQEWTGSELTPVITITDGETPLTEATDYTITPPNGTIQDAGDYTFTIAGAGNYAGETTATLTITAKQIVNEGGTLITTDQNGTVATIDETSINGGVVPDGVTNATLTYTRTLSEGTDAWTVCLPFVPPTAVYIIGCQRHDSELYGSVATS